MVLQKIEFFWKPVIVVFKSSISSRQMYVKCAQYKEIIWQYTNFF